MVASPIADPLDLSQLSPAELLPHRAPMLLIDRIIAYAPGTSIQAATTVRPDNIFFQGHFPGEPILPGIVLAEMMFQACGLFGRLEALSALSPDAAQLAGYRPKSGRAIKVDKLTFSQPVLPDDQLTITAVFDHRMLNFSIFHTKVEIAGRGVAAKGTVTVLINP